jgi:hypothetical protein
MELPALHGNPGALHRRATLGDKRIARTEPGQLHFRFRSFVLAVDHHRHALTLGQFDTFAGNRDWKYGFRHRRSGTESRHCDQYRSKNKPIDLSHEHSPSRNVRCPTFVGELGSIYWLRCLVSFFLCSVCGYRDHSRVAAEVSAGMGKAWRGRTMKRCGARSLMRSGTTRALSIRRSRMSKVLHWSWCEENVSKQILTAGNGRRMSEITTKSIARAD